MKKEFVCMEETIHDTQKKIRTWVSSGYTIELTAQHLVPIEDTNGTRFLITSLWRWKE